MASFAALGALQIGTLVSCMLFGVATTQTYIYFTRFPKDSRILKYLVTFVYACEIAHTLCIAHTLYVYTIVDYGKPLGHLKTDPIPKSLGANTFFTGVIAACVQSFFAWRIYTLSNNLIIPVFCWLLAAFRVAIGLLSLILGALNVAIAGINTTWHWIHPTVWGVSAANNVTLAMALIYWLYKQRPDRARTVSLVDTLIRWTLETGVVTTTADMVTLICSERMPDNYIWLAFYVMNAKLFSNALLASLNSRTTLRERDDKNITLPLSTTGVNRTVEFSARPGFQSTKDETSTGYETSAEYSPHGAK